MSLIELKNITFSYEDEVDTCTVFDNFSLEISEGECVCLRGDNGSGKTTLFRIINGLSFPSKGQYMYDGVNIDKKYLSNNTNSKAFHKKIGYLFQNPDVMLFNPRVYDEVAFGPRQMGLTEKEVDERVKDCFKLLDIESLSEKVPYHLSGGQKKKVALASVLALNPDVIIMDEPLAGLDEKTKTRLSEMICNMKAAGKTLIISTHDESFLNKIADRVIIL